MIGPYLAKVELLEEEVCPECEGEGYAIEIGTCIACTEPPERMVPCPVCDGTGYVWRHVEHATDEEPDPDDIPLELYDKDALNYSPEVSYA